MWIKRSIEEIKSLRKENAKSLALYASMLSVLLVAVTDKIGYYKSRVGFEPISWSELIQRVPLYLVLALIMYVLVFVWVSRMRTNHLKFCVKCEEVIQKTREKVCECGGSIEYLEEFKSVD